MTLRDKRLTASKISIDAIANIATYLQPDDEAMNLCIAVGGEGARIVRKRYLMNEGFSSYRSQSSTNYLFAALRDGVASSRRVQIVYQWMLVNDKMWRHAIVCNQHRYAAPIIKTDQIDKFVFRLTPFFSNPGVAVVLGLTFLVKVHFTRSDFDANGFYTTKVVSEGNCTNEQSVRIHLLYSAMLNDDVDTFNALVAHPKINLGSIARLGDERFRLIHSSMLVEKKNSPHFLRVIANHRSTDVNALIAQGDQMLTPLQWLMLNYGSTSVFGSSPRWALEILLEAGADTSLAPEEATKSPYDMAMIRVLLSCEEDDDDKLARYLDALVVMREWPASMKINGLVRGFLIRRRLAAARRRNLW